MPTPGSIVSDMLRDFNTKGEEIMRFDEMSYGAAYYEVTSDPGTRYSLREWLRVASSMDPVDALADAELLVDVLQKRVHHGSGS